jgi:hypothetical protein
MSENLENMSPNIPKLQPYDTMANTIEVSNALAKNKKEKKSPIDKITADYIGQKLEVTETPVPNPSIPFSSPSKTYTGILRNITPNYDGTLVSSIDLENSNGIKTIQNLKDSYVYSVKIFKGGLKHSNSKKRKSFRRKRNKKSLKKRKTKRTLRYKR